MNLISLNRDFYNTFAEDFSESRETINEGIKRSLTSLDLSRLIDVGCGDGRVSRLLPSTSFYAGADFSQKLIGRAATHGSFILADLSSPLPFAPQSFSAVVCYAALHHLPDRLPPLISMANLLKPDGRMAISVWQFTHLERFRKKIVDDLGNGDYLLSWERGGHGVRYVHQVTEDEIKRLAREASLSVEKMYYADGKTDDLSLYIILRRT
ncbi:MAG: methyltransferase domain-containing protein [Chloroflexi bacterium]|nr:methyltransferase domain-containing protein [Chloroflexota bacterium]